MPIVAAVFAAEVCRGCRRCGRRWVATDKIKGVANQVGGKVKEGVGKAIGNEQMQVEGKTQQKVGEAKSTIKDMADKVADKAHDKL
jgi:uncharacterized protein YjbJ (UPF0337 family)